MTTRVSLLALLITILTLRIYADHFLEPQISESEFDQYVWVTNQIAQSYQSAPQDTVARPDTQSALPYWKPLSAVLPLTQIDFLNLGNPENLDLAERSVSYDSSDRIAQRTKLLVSLQTLNYEDSIEASISLTRLGVLETAELATFIASLANEKSAQKSILSYLTGELKISRSRGGQVPFNAQIIREILRSTEDIPFIISLLSHNKQYWSEYLQRIYTQYGADHAFLLWLEAKAEFQPGQLWPQNSHFGAITTSYLPFDWKFSDDDAEYRREHGLTIYGRRSGKPKIITRQLVSLGPSKYRLKSIFQFSNVRYSSRPDSGYVWELKCDQSQEALAIIPLSESVRSVASPPFTVPNNCPFQWIQLIREQHFTNSEITLISLEFSEVTSENP